MNDLLYDDLDNLIMDIKNLNDFKRLKELNKIINEKYYKEISLFLSLKDDYNKSLEYKNINDDYKKIGLKLSCQKEKLYSFEEVKEYKELERKMQAFLDELTNEIALEMSNKFKTKRILE